VVGSSVLLVDFAGWFLLAIHFPWFYNTTAMGNASIEEVDIGKWSLLIILASFGVILISLATALKRSDFVSMVRAQSCCICQRGMGVGPYFLSKAVSSVAPSFYHQWCFEDLLGSQKGKCANCATSIPKPRSKETPVLAFLARGMLVCSAKCDEAYRSLKGPISKAK
jgi:hypothetical protein